MENMYQNNIYDYRHFGVVALNEEAAQGLVRRLKSRLNLDLERTYKMSDALPVSRRLYHPAIDNRPAVGVEISKRNGQGIVFEFRGYEWHPEDIRKIASVLGIELPDQKTSPKLQ